MVLTFRNRSERIKKVDVESAAKWKNIFTAAGFTGTNTSSDDAFWTTTVDPENDEQFNYVYYMGVDR